MSTISKLQVKNEFKSFLTSCRVEKGQPFTHTSLDGGSYLIEKNKYEEFIKLYTEHVFVNNNKCCLTEKHEDYGPVLVDLDFRFNVPEDNIPKREYNHAHLKKFISRFSIILNKYIKIDTNEELNCYVFEKTQPIIEKNYLKDGVHMMFPHLITSPEFQFHIRKEIIKDFKDIFSDIEFTNTYEDIYDEAVLKKNNWQMYGSSKPNKEPYLLTKIYSSIWLENDEKTFLKLEEIQEDIPKATLVRLLSIRNKKCNIQYNKNIEKDLLTELSKYKKVTKPLKLNIIPGKKKKINRVNDDKLEEIKKLVDILSPDRSDNQLSWMEVGWCLHNIDYRLLNTWIEFSKKSSKFEEGECEKLWINMANDGLQEPSLHRWCKIDNLEEYNIIISNCISELIKKSLNATTTDISRVVFAMYKHQFRCGSIKFKTWYEFDGSRWTELDQGVNLRKKISNDVVNEYLKLEADYAQKAINCPENDPTKMCLNQYSKKLVDVSIKLRQASFKETLMKDCSEIFWEDKFIEKLDCNIDLIGFENGVYDLENMEFREGRAEDYISLTTGINYIDYNEAPYIQDVMDFMDQVLPIRVVRDYVIKLFASFLNGKIGEEKFHIWTGTGGNGKSKLIELFELAFGDYCCKLPITLLTQKRAASNSATPELARTKGKRFACLQEPDENERINVGIMKEMSGGDKIQGRALYKEPIEFKPQFKMVLTCNKLPDVPPDDGGTWRRLRVVEFESEFVEDPDPDKPNQFPIDYELSSKLKLWAPTFMSILIHYYKDYKENGCQDPEQVKRRTAEYRSSNDIYSDFINDHIVESDVTARTKIKEIYTCFKEWFKDNDNGKKLPSNKDVKTYFDKKYKKIKQEYVGIKVVHDDEEDIMAPLE